MSRYWSPLSVFVIVLSLPFSFSAWPGSAAITPVDTTEVNRTATAIAVREIKRNGLVVVVIKDLAPEIVVVRTNPGTSGRFDRNKKPAGWGRAGLLESRTLHRGEKSDGDHFFGGSCLHIAPPDVLYFVEIVKPPLRNDKLASARGALRTGADSVIVSAEALVPTPLEP